MTTPHTFARKGQHVFAKKSMTEAELKAMRAREAERQLSRGLSMKAILLGTTALLTGNF